MKQVGIGAKPDILPLSIGDGVLAEHADSVVSVPEIFNYWLQAGRVDVASSAPPRWTATRTSTPRSSGLTRARRCASPARAAPRDRGLGEGGGHHPEAEASRFRRGTRLRHLGRAPLRRRLPQGLGYSGAGPTVVITDLGILRPDPETRELTMTALHPGTTVQEATGWELEVAEELETTDPPTEKELRILRDLKARTEASRNRPRVWGR